MKKCKDCIREGIKSNRKANYPGPRCYTHHKARKKAKKRYNHSEHVKKLYGLSYDEYWKIYEHQGGKCAICQRATGQTKKLSVDHDHTTGLVRMLLCTRCNRMVGHLRDDPEAFERGARSLREPPATLALGHPKYVPVGGAPVKDKNYTGVAK